MSYFEQITSATEANAARLPFIARSALGLDTEELRPFPAFDPDHPDEEILCAFERVREHRAWAYAQEDVNDGHWPKGFEEKSDELALHQEGLVEGNFASSPAGVAARLSLLIPAIAEERWVDRCVVEKGLLSLYKERGGLDGNGAQLAQAAYELIFIEWDYALAAYERSVAGYRFAQDVIDQLRDEFARVPGTEIALGGLLERAREVEKEVCNMAIINRLMRTLAPDEEELLRKTQILAKEHLLDEYSGPWLARDAAFLAGKLDGAPSRKSPRARMHDSFSRQPSDGCGPSSTIQTAFAKWRACWSKSFEEVGVDENIARNEIKSAAFHEVLASPAVTTSDFMVKSYIELLEANGPVFDGNSFDPDPDQFSDPRDHGDAYKRSVYADLNRSDLGACLLAFGRPNFVAEDWIERAKACSLPMSLHPTLQVGPVETSDTSCAREQHRLVRILNFDANRKPLVEAMMLAGAPNATTDQAA